MISECTKGYSGSDIAHVASEALLRPIRELEEATHWLPVEGLLQPCSCGLPGALQMSLKDILPHEVFPVLQPHQLVDDLAFSICARFS